MRIGLLSYSSNNGLGTQCTYGYYKHLRPSKTMVVDLSAFNSQKIYPERYMGKNQIGQVMFVRGFPQTHDINAFLPEKRDLDILLVAENALNPYLFTRARQTGVKIVQVFNYEFLDALLDDQLPKPDMMLAPSTWHMDEMHNLCHEWGVDFCYLPVPVDRKQLPFTQRTQAKKFLHIVGHKAAADRNGTDTVLAAISRVKAQDVEFIIRTQTPLPHSKDPRVKVIIGDVENYWDIYKDNADVLLWPRRYGGLSLPLNEAMSLGMIPLVSNLSPQNAILTYPYTLRARLLSTLEVRIGKLPVYDVDPSVLAARIDMLANMPSEDVTMLSEKINDIIDETSWDNLLPTYQEVFEHLLHS